jgi:hypothetical protein
VDIYKGIDSSILDGYKDWRKHHSNGFVLNLLDANRGVLHSASCIHLDHHRNHGKEANLTAKAKVCLIDRREIEGWIKN